MLGYVEKYFNKFFFIVCSLVFIIICLRAFFVPFSHDESLTFFFYIQNGNYLPYKAHVYTNNHVLNSALANICYHIAGSHKFILRIPNILSFIIFCFGVFKFSKHLNNVLSKIVLTTLFVLTFNFLDFFELCRGYGISIGFMILGLAFLQDYFSEKKISFLLFFFICLQLALAANLILIVILTLLTLYILIFQFYNKHLFNKKNAILQLINLSLLIFWIKFSLFYRDSGSLDSGIGDNYWEVTFKSLILLIFGNDLPWIQILIVTVFCILLFSTIIIYFKNHFNFDSIFKPHFFYLINLIALIVAFYLQKKYLNVNYPEDRTALFFYLFFVLSLAFFFDFIPKYFSLAFAYPLLIANIIYFVSSFNLTDFTYWFYHVIPKKIYSHLQYELKKDPHLFTIGGYPYREMTYAFLNYRGHATLNPMDPAESMHMNCDYSFALKAEKPYYQFFYDEIDYDEKYNRVLLKRKQKIERQEQTQFTINSKNFKGNNEWFEFVRFNDTAIKTKNCLEADIRINFKNVPKPFNAFLVFQLNDIDDKNVFYKRIPLSWIADDLNGLSHQFKITTGPLPEKFGNANVHIWNIDKKEVEFSITDLKIFELKAPGINVVIPKDFYRLVKSITNERLL